MSASEYHPATLEGMCSAGYNEGLKKNDNCFHKIDIDTIKKFCASTHIGNVELEELISVEYIHNDAHTLVPLRERMETVQKLENMCTVTRVAKKSRRGKRKASI